MPDGRPYDPHELERMRQAMLETTIPVAPDASPLDRAVAKAESDARYTARMAAEGQQRAATGHDEAVKLIRDFLARMNVAGNPGADQKVEEGRWPFKRRTPAWLLVFSRGDKVERFWLTVDGRVHASRWRAAHLVGPAGEPGLVRFEQSKISLSTSQLEVLALSMAEVLRKTGVT